MSARLAIHLRGALSLLPLVAFPRTSFRPRLGLFVVLRRPRTRLHRHTNTKRTTTLAFGQSHLAVPSSDTVPQISWHPPLSASFLGAQIDANHGAWYRLAVPAVSTVHRADRNKVGGHHTVVVAAKSWVPCPQRRIKTNAPAAAPRFACGPRPLEETLPVARFTRFGNCHRWPSVPEPRLRDIKRGVPRLVSVFWWFGVRNLGAERGKGGKVVFPACVWWYRAAALPPSVSRVVGWWRHGVESKCSKYRLVDRQAGRGSGLGSEGLGSLFPGQRTLKHVLWRFGAGGKRCDWRDRTGAAWWAEGQPKIT